MRKNLLKVVFAFLFATLSIMTWAQERTITGKVTSSDDGSTLPGVNVVVKGSTNGTVTDSEGRFSLSVSPGSTLVLSFIGLKTQEIEVGERTVIDVQMANDVTQLSEVIVVAYGTQEKKTITGSVASVNSEAFKNQPVTGLDQAMQGRMAGVQVTQNSGTPGSGIAVRVRGSSSITGSNEPLYVVDGVPINTGSYSNIGVGNQQTSAINDINPNDIASIEVLKDAAASALYGSRAANGVVLITTKRGSSGNKTKISFNYYGGVQETWKRLTPLTGPQFVDALADGLVSRFGIGNGTAAAPAGLENADGTVTTGSIFGSGSQTWLNKNHLASWFWAGNSNFSVDANGRAVVARSGTPLEVRDANFFLDPSTSPSTNWQNEVFRSAPIANYELSAQGGNDKTKFAVSGNYFNQLGIVKGSGFERMSGRINLDHAISDKFSIGTNTAFTSSINNRINNDNNIFGVVSGAILMAPDVPKYLASGLYGRDPSSTVDNPLASALEPTNKAVSNRLLTGAFAQYEFIPGLNFKTSISLDYLYFREQRFLPTTTNQGLSTNGQGNANTSQDVNWINENVLTYRKAFNQVHNFSALLGTSFQESNFSNIQASATGFPGNDIRQVFAGAVKTDAQSSATSWAIRSGFTRLSYDFKGKYFFTGSFRVDESSRFAQNNRTGYFPSFSGGWRIKEESFMDGLTFISELKLRGSYGITGNQEIGNFNYLALFGSGSPANATGGSNFNQIGGFAPVQLPNPNLTWEKTAQTDIGIDIGLIKSRLNISVDYYIKTTTDLLLTRPVPGVSGFATYSQNIGEMENKGFEVVISATPISSNSGLVWNSDFNISFNRNKIVSLGADVAPFAAGFASWVTPGEPIGAFRGFKVVDLIRTQEQLNNLNAGSPNGVYQSTATRVGDIQFEDVTGDGRVTGDDQKILGNAQPDFIGGWTNTLRYKGFDFSAFFQFVSGNKIYNNTRAFSEGMNSIFGSTEAVLRRWTPTNTNTNVPRAINGDAPNNRRTSDRWLEDGSFVRLKNVVFGYTLPASLTSKMKISSLRVYFSGQNLLTWTNYSGLDPEVNTFSGSNIALGTDFLTFPQARVYTFGVNIGF
ncbi:MAG: TonB-dependent receptor [Chryseotalea sp. WA131a]|nr:MAG: TonB-dependent receptor [Chryseotalea sp. WA131a]